MKKLLTTLSLIGVAGAMSFGVAFGVNQTAKEAKATDPESYIEMSTAFFTNWTDDAGTIKDVGATFWGDNYSFEALGKFYCGESKEGWTGTLTSRTWKQSTPYIYFQLGAAMDYRVDGDNAHDALPDAGDPVYLKIHAGSKTYDFYNNTFVENPMTLRYFEIPAADFVELTENSVDFDMSIDVVDPKTRNFGFANFGYLHVNQTRTQVGDAMRYFLNHLSTDSRSWEVNKRKEIFNSYWANEYQRAIFFESAGDNVDDSFSTNSDFVNHWYFDHNYFNNNYGTARHFDCAISEAQYRPFEDNSNMPYNNDGGFFRGWYVEDGESPSGFSAADNQRYRFISRPFVLSGTGIVSIKMAGTASLHVIDASVQNTDSQPADLAWINNHAYKTSGSTFNIADSDFNTVTLVNHVVNLEAYLGKKIQLAICDYSDGGWGAAYFDELVTKYTSAPGYHVDTTVQTNSEGTRYPSLFDIYVNSTRIADQTNPYGIDYVDSNAVNTAENNKILNHVDSSASLSAHNVWKSYIHTVRGDKVGRNYCSNITSAAYRAVIGDYNDLSEEAKTIVCNSDDFERVGGGDWYTINPTIYGSEHTYCIGKSIANIAAKNDMSVAVYGYIPGIDAISFDSTSLIAILISISAIALLGIMLLSYRKRKEK